MEKITIIQGNYERKLHNNEQLPLASRPSNIQKIHHDILAGMTKAAKTIIEKNAPEKVNLSTFTGNTIKGKNTVTYEGSISILNHGELKQETFDIITEYVTRIQNSLKQVFIELETIYKKEAHTPGKTYIQNAAVETDSIYGIENDMVYLLVESIRLIAIKSTINFEYKLPNGLIQNAKIHPTTSDITQEINLKTISFISEGIKLKKAELDIKLQIDKQFKSAVLIYSTNFKMALLESLISQATISANAKPYSSYINGKKSTPEYELVDIIDANANSNIEIEFPKHEG